MIRLEKIISGLIEMGGYGTPYKVINWDRFPFTKEDVKYIHHLYFNESKSKKEIREITKLTEHYVGRIISTIQVGKFDDVLYNGLIPLNDELEDETKGNIIHIHDGINIEIHNHYDNQDTTNKIPKLKINKGKLTNWSKKIRARDNYTCSVCGKYDKQHMEAHHIEPQSINPSRALDELNGVCICQKCHREYNNRYEPKNQNGVTFSRFIFEKNRGY